MELLAGICWTKTQSLLFPRGGGMGGGGGVAWPWLQMSSALDYNLGIYKYVMLPNHKIFIDSIYIWDKNGRDKVTIEAVS